MNEIFIASVVTQEKNQMIEWLIAHMKPSKAVCCWRQNVSRAAGEVGVCSPSQRGGWMQPEEHGWAQIHITHSNVLLSCHSA